MISKAFVKSIRKHFCCYDADEIRFRQDIAIEYLNQSASICHTMAYGVTLTGDDGFVILGRAAKIHPDEITESALYTFWKSIRDTHKRVHIIPLKVTWRDSGSDLPVNVKVLDSCADIKSYLETRYGHAVESWEKDYEKIVIPNKGRKKPQVERISFYGDIFNTSIYINLYARRENIHLTDDKCWKIIHHSGVLEKLFPIDKRYICDYTPRSSDTDSYDDTTIDDFFHIGKRDDVICLCEKRLAYPYKHQKIDVLIKVYRSKFRDEIINNDKQNPNRL